MKLVVIGFIALMTSAGAFANNCDREYAGVYVWGSEVNSFRSCGSEKKYWVSATSWTKAPLIDLATGEGSQPYQRIFVRFRGHLLDEELDGFAASHDGLMRISEIYEASRTIPESCEFPE